MDAPASSAMADRVRELAHDDEVRCVAVTGEGDAFCAGLDMAGDMGGANPAEELETGFDAIARGLIRMEKPTVAKVPCPARRSAPASPSRPPATSSTPRTTPSSSGASPTSDWRPTPARPTSCRG